MHDSNPSKSETGRRILGAFWSDAYTHTHIGGEGQGEIEERERQRKYIDLNT